MNNRNKFQGARASQDSRHDHVRSGCGGTVWSPLPSLGGPSLEYTNATGAVDVEAVCGGVETTGTSTGSVGSSGLVLSSSWSSADLASTGGIPQWSNAPLQHDVLPPHLQTGQKTDLETMPGTIVPISS